MHIFVFNEPGSVRNYVDANHPVLLTLNGQNHGELTRTLISSAGLPEISARAIIEIRLDGLEQEALGEIVSNSREQPKNSDFTRALRATIETLIQNDPDLANIERRLEEEKARQSSADLSRKAGSAGEPHSTSSPISEGLARGRGGLAPLRTWSNIPDPDKRS